MQMMMPPHIRATFMPNPPLKHLPSFKPYILLADVYVTDDDEAKSNNNMNNAKTKSEEGPSGITKIPTSFPKKKRGAGLSGVSTFLHHFERTAPPDRKIDPTPKSLKEEKAKAKKAENEGTIAPAIEKYREDQRGCGGEFTNGMNCYNTLFVGRLAYEVTERKLLREMEAYGNVKDLKLITDKVTGKSKGFAFVEYEHEEDMKRAFRAADGMRLEGRAIVVDVERGHTVPNWLPRKFGGGLGGTRIGGADQNVHMAGRFDPNKQPPPPDVMMGGGMGMGGGGPPGHGMGMGPPGGMGGGPGMGPPGGMNGPPPGCGGRGRYDDRGPPRYDDRGPPGGFGGGGHGGRGRYDDRGPPPGYGDRGGYRGGPPQYNNRGPPPPRGGYNNGPPPLAWERGGRDGGGRDDRKRRRSRSRSPDRRRGRY